MPNNSSEETVTMDGSNDPLVCKYPLTDPQWSSFNKLAEEANKMYYQQRSFKIKYHMNPKKNGKNPSRPNLASNKPIYYMCSAVEGASSRLKLNLLHTKKKTIKKNYANEVLNEYSFPKEEEDVMIKNDSKAESSFKENDHVMKMKKSNGLKCTHETFISDIEENIDALDAFINDEENYIDVLDQEWVQCESSKKKQKNSKGCVNNKRQKLKQVSNDDAANTTPPDLPQEFKNKINEMGGNQITLVIQKSLYKTDLSPQHNRLSMPLKQIKNASFLREEELEVLEKKQVIEVKLLQPSLELKNITLAKWDMPKLLGPTNSTYVLRSSWMKVVGANQLQQNDVVQVWSFRVQEELFMALVKLQTINL